MCGQLTQCRRKGESGRERAPEFVVEEAQVMIVHS